MLLIIGSSVSSYAQTSQKYDQNDYSIKKEKIIKYLHSVVAGGYVITGQHCGNGNATAQGYTDYVEGLYKATGKYPALIGLEYGYSPGNDLNFINGFALRHAAKGGFITITWHADNPWVEGYNCRWNSVENKYIIDFRKLLKDAPDSEEKSNYRNELMKVGAALQQLQEAGVVVLWRPFHEMNGSWFWWGPDDLKSPQNSEEYRLLWKDMYETFTSVLGLNNLIWIYSPIAKSEWTATLDCFYPGEEWVDIYGVDIYSSTPEFKDYDDAKKHGMPVVAGEIGPVKEAYGSFDALETMEQMRGKAAWFLQWSSWTDAKVALVDNPNAKKMMNHPSSVTLDSIELK